MLDWKAMSENEVNESDLADHSKFPVTKTTLDFVYPNCRNKFFENIIQYKHCYSIFSFSVMIGFVLTIYSQIRINTGIAKDRRLLSTVFSMVGVHL